MGYYGNIVKLLVENFDLIESFRFVMKRGSIFEEFLFL